MLILFSAVDTRLPQRFDIIFRTAFIVIRSLAKARLEGHLSLGKAMQNILESSGAAQELQARVETSEVDVGMVVGRPEQRDGF